MKRIAIVEDDLKAAELLSRYLEQYSTTNNEEMSITRFVNGINFLTNYKAVFDIVFMDIEMPDLDGMEAAKKLRELDNVVTLIFVTNMAQYAVKGYEVGAFDYIVKPVTYPNFVVKFKRAIEHVKNKSDYKITVTTNSGVSCVNASQLKYIEVTNHQLVYHTINKDIIAYGQLKKIEEELIVRGFERCNSCYLINLRHVAAIDGYTVDVAGDRLSVSHAKKKQFMKRLADYLGGVGN